MFWHFINERHKVYLNKEQELPKPWTQDEILQHWKFCNVYRWLDYQSQCLTEIISNVWDVEPRLMVFNIFAFRAFNWFPTYECLGFGASPPPWIWEWDYNLASKLLEEWIKRGNQLTSGAYMIRGREGMPKWKSILQTLDDLWNGKDAAIAKKALETNSLQETVQEILNQELWGWGPFTAYQVALDLSYTRILADPFDINEWCEFGPGAKRGIKLIYPELKSTDYLQAAKQLLADQAFYLKPHMREMTLQDIEFSLCELQKYHRIFNGGKGKEKYNGT